MSRNQPCVVPVLGATGSGKSVFLQRLLSKTRPARCLIWNPLQDKTPYPGDVVKKLSDLVSLMRERRFRLVFVPTWDREGMANQFDIFCRAALAAENLTMVVEELKYVTRPGWSPRAWTRATGDGRQYGLKIFGTSQRPAQIDKDFLGNATLIHTGRLAYHDDVTTVAKYMRIPESEISGLQPLEWVEVDKETGKKMLGRLTF